MVSKRLSTGSAIDLSKTELMGWTLPIAKGCGQAMKVVFSAILFPVSRNTVTWLRCKKDKN